MIPEVPSGRFSQTWATHQSGPFFKTLDDVVDLTGSHKFTELMLGTRFGSPLFHESWSSSNLQHQGAPGGAMLRCGAPVDEHALPDWLHFPRGASLPQP